MIDDQSDPGEWAEALRYPNAIKILPEGPHRCGATAPVSFPSEAETLPLSEPSGHLTGAVIPPVLTVGCRPGSSPDPVHGGISA